MNFKLLAHNNIKASHKILAGEVYKAMADYMTVTEALEVLSVSRPTICAWCENGNLDAKKELDKSSRGFHWVIEKNSVLRKQLEMSGDKHKQDEAPEGTAEKIEPAPAKDKDGDIDKMVDSFGMQPAEADRMKAILKGLSKTQAETVLKSEQAMKALKENLADSGRYIDTEIFKADAAELFSGFFRTLRSLVDVWGVRLHCTPEEIVEMQKEYEAAIQKMYGDFRKVSGINGKG